MTEENIKYKKLQESIKNLQKTVDRFITDYNDDKEQDIERFRHLNSFINIGQEIKFNMENIEKIIQRGYKEVTEAVEEAGDELGEHVQRVKATIDKKEVIRTYIVREKKLLGFVKKIFPKKKTLSK